MTANGFRFLTSSYIYIKIQVNAETAIINHPIKIFLDNILFPIHIIKDFLIFY